MQAIGLAELPSPVTCTSTLVPELTNVTALFV